MLRLTRWRSNLSNIILNEYSVTPKVATLNSCEYLDIIWAWIKWRHSASNSIILSCGQSQYVWLIHCSFMLLIYIKRSIPLWFQSAKKHVLCRPNSNLRGLTQSYRLLTWKLCIYLLLSFKEIFMQMTTNFSWFIYLY